jgi:hypothetical protein
MSNESMEVEIILAPAKGRRGGRKAVPKVPSDQPRIPRITRLMALAIKFQDMVDRGEVRDYADIARLGFVTRARITQIMNLLNLAPDIQEQLLTSSNPATEAAVPERGLRPVTAVVEWRLQRKLWKSVLDIPTR